MQLRVQMGSLHHLDFVYLYLYLFIVFVFVYLYAIVLYAVQLNAAQGADRITCTISTLCGAQKFEHWNI